MRDADARAAACAPRQDEEPAWAEIPAQAARPITVEPARRLGASGPHEPSGASVVGWTLVVLALIAGAAILARRLLRRSGLMGGAGPIRVLARRALAPRQDLFLVEIGSRVLLIGSTRDRLATLGEFARADDVAAVRASCAADGPAETEFRAALRETLKEAERPAPAPAGKPAMADLAGELADLRKTVEGWRA